MDETLLEINEKLQTLTALSLANTGAIQQLILRMAEKGDLSLPELASLDTIMANPFQDGKVPATRAVEMLRAEHTRSFQLARDAIAKG